jgi:hypothetical protein
MSSLAAAMPRSSAQVRVLALVLFLLCFGAIVLAQCPSSQNDPYALPKVVADKPEDEEPMLPEAGFLSNSRYTSQFFGFAFDLPLSVQGHQIMMPVMPEKEHALLALQYEQNTRRGYIMVTAIDPRPGMQANTPEQQEAELKNWARGNMGIAGPSDFVIPDYMLRSGRFYYSVRHKGADYSAQYWTRVNNYVVKAVIGTNDQAFLRKAKAAMAEASFYCPQDDGTLMTRDGKPVKVEGEPYDGPTVPTFRVNEAIRTQPGKDIPTGLVQDGVYRNPGLQLQYELPKGWSALAEDKSSDPPEDANALREYNFLHSCSKTLLRIAPQSPDKEISGSMIVLRALDPNCLSMRTATSVSDKPVADEVGADLEEMAEFGQIDTDQLVSLANHVFMVFHGTLPPAPQHNQDLAERMSQSIFLTRHDEMLLVWSLIAPTSKALNAIPTSGIVFDGSPPIELASTLKTKK